MLTESDRCAPEGPGVGAGCRVSRLQRGQSRTVLQGISPAVPLRRGEPRKIGKQRGGGCVSGCSMQHSLQKKTQLATKQPSVGVMETHGGMILGHHHLGYRSISADPE